MMKNRFSQYFDYRTVYWMAVILGVLGWMVYLVFGHPIIEMIYHGEFPIHVFDPFIKKTHTIESNYHKVDERLMGLTIIIGLFLISHFLITRGKYSFQFVLEKHFLRATESYSINLFRFLYCGLLAYGVLKSGGILPTGTFNPIPLFDFFGIGLLEKSVFQLLHTALVTTLSCAALGFFTRTTLTLSWVEYFVYKGTELSFSKSAFSNYVYHSENIVIMILLILSFSPGIAIFGIDGLRRRQWKWSIKNPSEAMISAWSSQLIKLTLGLAYFGSGYCKIINSPLWADGYTLQAYLLEKHLIYNIPLGYWIAHQYWACLALSVLTLFIELTFFFVVFFPKTTLLYVVAGLGLHISILFVMKINFLKVFGLTYLVFLSWPAIIKVISSLVRLFSPNVSQRLSFNKIKEKNDVTVPLYQSFTLIGRCDKKYKFSKLFVIGFTMMLFSCVIFRVESWPFTDYRVYEGRMHYTELKVYRLQGIDYHGRSSWLEQPYLKVDTTTLNIKIRMAYRRLNSQQLQQLILPLIKYENADLSQQFSKIILIKRTVELDSHYQIHVFDTPLLQVL